MGKARVAQNVGSVDAAFDFFFAAAEVQHEKDAGQRQQHRAQKDAGGSQCSRFSHHSESGSTPLGVRALQGRPLEFESHTSSKQRTGLCKADAANLETSLLAVGRAHIVALRSRLSTMKPSSSITSPTGC